MLWVIEKKEKLLFYIKVECMCDEKLVVSFPKIETKERG